MWKLHFSISRPEIGTNIGKRGWGWGGGVGGGFNIKYPNQSHAPSPRMQNKHQRRFARIGNLSVYTVLYLLEICCANICNV